MKIKSLQLSFLRNKEHFQFHSGVKKSIQLLTASTLNIEGPFTIFLHLYNKENETLEELQKNNIPEDLVDADNNRDITLCGMLAVIKSATNHFRVEVRQSGSHLQSLFENYGSNTISTYDDQTAATNKLVEELVGMYASDVATIGLSEWVSQLKIKNLTFDSLKKSRYSDNTSLTQLAMKHTRTELDNAYLAIINRINALIELEGEDNYKQFVLEMNEQIDAYDELLAIRKGKSKKPSQTTSQPDIRMNQREQQM